MPDERLTLARYPDICSECKGKVEKGAMIRFNTFYKTVRHVKCVAKQEGKKEGKNA
jgi:hypothetical protein